MDAILSAFAWPLCLSVALLVAARMFRADLSAFLKRIKKAGAVEFDKAGDQAASGPPDDSVSEFLASPVSRTVQEFERHARKVLDEVPGLADPGERIKVLHRLFAQATVARDFQFASAVIFGTQLQLLVDLSGGNRTLPMTHAETLFRSGMSGYEPGTEAAGFTAWLGFLQRQGFVVVQETQLDITQRGQDFLSYLVETRQAHQRDK